jgi:hypothetical protein
MEKQIKSIAIILCLFISICLQAQEIVTGYSLGYGKYFLDDLKTLQEKSVESVQEIFENYKSTETFPEGLFHNAYFGVKFSFHEIGLKYDYLTSGGRCHLADYSGEIKEDLTVLGNAFGLYYKIHFLSLPLNNRFRLTAHAGIATGAIYNKIENKSLFALNNPESLPSGFYPGYVQIGVNQEFEKIDETINIYSTNWYVQPHIGIRLGFKNTVFLNIDAGYLFDNPGKLQTAKGYTSETTVFVDRSGYSYYSNEIVPGKEYNVGADWSGLRLSLGIGFAFSIMK